MARVKAAVGRCKKWVTFENVFKAVVLLMVWGLMSFPVVMYFASKKRSVSSSSTETISELLQTLEGNCDPGPQSDLNDTSNGSLTLCSSHSALQSSAGSWSNNSQCQPLNTGLCVAHQRAGNSSAVQPYYPALKEVIRVRDAKTPFNCSTAASVVSNILTDVQSAISNFNEPSCEEKGLPFLCSYLMPTCNSDGEVAYATAEECEYIRDRACKKVWRLASAIKQYRALLPRCSELMNRTAGNRSHTKPPVTNHSTCHPLFVQTDCVCLPSCGTFRTRTDPQQAVEDTTIFLAIISCFVSTVIYLAFLVKRRKAMLKYPTVLVLYATLCITFFAFIVFVGRIVPENALFCSHPDLLHTMTDSPTPFCVISGITFQFSIILAFTFWTVHIIHIWITVDLPNLTFTKKLRTHSKVVHIAVVSACILLSSLGPIVTLAKYKYVVIRVPALTCTPDDLDIVFASLIFPCVILVATSTSFLVLLFWTVYKKQEMLRGGKCLKTPELKILCLSLFYIVCGVVVLARFGGSTGGRGGKIQKLIDFGLCHLVGESESLECPLHASISSTKSVTLSCLTYLLLGCLPIFSLVFAFTSSDLERVLVCCKRLARTSEASKAYLSTSSASKKGDSQRIRSVSQDL